ncbi:MAG: flagellar assembly protein FliW [Firmicutes bacterium]|nr:flagellar assembly protein FliW [Bacillota bacterium]
MKLQTKLGSLDIKEEDIITFPRGILGFADYRQYVIVEQEEGFFSFLQSVDEPGLAFVIMIPELVNLDYSVKLAPEEIELLQLKTPDDGRVYGIVTVPDNVAEMTVNLQAPLVINVKEKLGAQVIQMEGSYHTRHNVLAEMQKNVYLQTRKSAAAEKMKETV